MRSRPTSFGALRPSLVALLTAGGLLAGPPALAQAPPVAPANGADEVPSDPTPTPEDGEPPPAPEDGEAPPAPERDEARRVYGQATRAFEAGDFQAAADGFRRANELVPAPHAEYWRAVSLDRSNRDVAALEAYEAYLENPEAEKVGEEPLLTARRRVKELLAKLAVVELATTPPAAVTVNGTASGTTPIKLRLEPGVHRVVLSADGYRIEELTVRAVAGQSLAESFALTPVAPAAPPPAPAPPTPPPAPPAAAPVAIEEPDRTAGYVLLGLTGAGALVGSYFGLKALSATADFDDHPNEELADDAERYALISDIGFGAAITFGVTALVVLTASPDQAKAATHARRRRAARPFQLAPLVSSKGGGAAARFSF